MTSLEERIRRALRERADRIPADAVPPLVLPARRWLAPAASAVLVVAVIAGSVVVSRIVAGARAPGPGAASSPGAARSEAAGWIAAQVSRSAVVSCDPAMCRALRARGIPARDLDVLKPGADPLRSQVIVATADVRRAVGPRLGSVYAPAIIASFGWGGARIDVRVIAPHGAAAYRSALSADLAARKAAGTQVLASPRIRVSSAARRQLLAGHVDTRLLIAIVTISGQSPVRILAFGDPGPGAGAGSPLRSAELTGTGNSPAADFSSVEQMLAFLRAQRPPYAPARAARASLPGGQPVLRVEYAAPAPLGLLATSPAP